MSLPRAARPPPESAAPVGRALRFWGPLGLLAAGAVLAVVAYRQMPWARAERVSAAGPAPVVVDERAARVAALTTELDRMLASPLTFAQVPALEDRLARLRREGAAARAAALASRAARALEEVAARELDGGDIDAGVAHYKIALSVDPGAQGTSQLAATLRGRAEAALRANHAGEAVRWARTVVGLAEADPDAHALLAEALSAAREDDGPPPRSTPRPWRAGRPIRRSSAAWRARASASRAVASSPRTKAGAATRAPAASEVKPAAPGEETEDDERSPAEAKSDSKPEKKSERKAEARPAAGSTSGEATPEQ